MQPNSFLLFRTQKIQMKSVTNIIWQRLVLTHIPSNFKYFGPYFFYSLFWTIDQAFETKGKLIRYIVTILSTRAAGSMASAQRSYNSYPLCSSHMVPSLCSVASRASKTRIVRFQKRVCRGLEAVKRANY